ncbi:MAG: 3-phosphoglycerate dehydrogenase [Clostridiales bacterium]|nr:3-phosphoglycerate dehydrogenase [Clostridiales bacterium]
MYNILTLNKISKVGLDKLDKSKYTCGDDIKNPDAILVRSASMHEMTFAPETIAVGRAGAGVNNIPVDRCADEGICVFNTPGANANAVKELVIASLFLASRKIADAIDWCKTLKGQGEGVGKAVEKGKSAFAGPEILGKTLGVIGMGAIGAMVADSAKLLGMNVVGYDPFLNSAAASDFEAKGIKIVEDLDGIYAQADYITLHVPLNDSTRGTVNAASIAKMKDGVRILNFARGELCDSDDLISALDSGKVSAYVTDFPTDAQLSHPGVTAIPHLGASTPESEENCAAMAAQEVADYLEKGIIKNSVNMPNTAVSGSFNVRNIFIYKDSESVTQQLKALCPCGVFFTAVKKGTAYTVIDCDKEISADGIEGIIRQRTIKS